MAITDLLKSCPIFFDLFDNEIEKVVKKCKVFQFHKNEYIIRQGEAGKEILILLEGDASAQKEIDGKLYLVEQYRKGSIFGSVVLIEEKNYSTHFIAENEVHVLKIPFQNLLTIFDSDSRVFGIICLNLCRILASRLEKFRHSIYQEAISLKEVDEKLNSNVSAINQVIMKK